LKDPVHSWKLEVETLGDKDVTQDVPDLALHKEMDFWCVIGQARPHFKHTRKRTHAACVQTNITTNN